MSQRILILQTLGNPRHFTPHEGILTLARHLDRSRWTMGVAVPRPGRLTEALGRQGVRIFRVAGLDSYRRHDAWWRIPWVASQVVWAARRMNASLLMANHPELGPFALVAARLCRLPWISFLRHSEQSPRYYRKYFITSANAVGGVCEAAIKSYREFLEQQGVSQGPLCAVRTGFDLPNEEDPSARDRLRATLGWDSSHRVIGTVGSRSVARKRPELLIEAVAKLSDRTPQVCALLLGDLDLNDRQRLVDRARVLGVSRRVHVAGRQDEMESYYRAMDIYAHPSRSEGLPKAVLEAMMYRLPVVAFGVGGIPEAVEDRVTGLLCPPDDRDAFTGHLYRLLSDPELATRMGRAGRARVEEQFSSITMTRQMMDLFDRALARRREGTLP